MYKLGIIGVGKMGSAILNGILSSNLYQKDDILLCLHEKHLEEMKKENYHITLSVKDILNECEIILIAIKPQKFAEVFQDNSSFDFKNKTVLSIAAGITISTLENLFQNAFIVRAMPNTPAFINKAVITYCCNSEDKKGNEVVQILSSIGKVYKIKEDEMDATLPLNGSMPAYIGEFVNEFIKIAVKNGLDYEKAKELTIESIISSCKLMKVSTQSIETQIENVCSKGGTTIAGLNQLKENNFDEAIDKCFISCMERSKELSK